MEKVQELCILKECSGQKKL